MQSQRAKKLWAKSGRQSMSRNPVAYLDRRIRRKLEKWNFERLSNRYRSYGPDRQFPILSPEWLIHREILYGGLQKKVRRNLVSPHDPRTPAELATSGMSGGDRMLHHGYAGTYSENLARFDRERRLTIAEFGILRGNGLAIWCDLFPNSRVMGFDIDVAHFENNRKNLIDRGAFSANVPEIYRYDQYERSERLLASILAGATVDICMDDGCHTDEAILLTMESVMPHLSEKFVYIVEDNDRVHEKIERRYPKLSVESHGKLTVVTDKGA